MAKRGEASAPKADKATIADVAALLNEMGFRAKPVAWAEGRSALLSAAGGVSFNVVGGQRGDTAALADVAFVASFQLPRPLANLPGEWNRQRRFARVYYRDALLVLEMDLLLPATGALDHLRGAAEIWNRLVNELVATIQAQAAGEAD